MQKRDDQFTNSPPPAPAAAGSFKPTTWDPATRRIDVVLSTGAIVRRRSWSWDGPEEYDEELVVSADAVDLTRINTGAPFLLQHEKEDSNALLGTCLADSGRIEDNEVVATVEFVPEELAIARAVEPYIQEIARGYRPNVSVGYKPLTTVKTERSDNVPLHQITRWLPMEVSSVIIPADNDAGYRSHPQEQRAMSTKNAPVTEPAAPPSPVVPAAPAAPTITAEQRAMESRRIADIHLLARMAGIPLDDALIRNAVTNGTAMEGAGGFIELCQTRWERDAQRSDAAGITTAHRAEVGVSEDVKLYDAMATAMCHRVMPGKFALTNGAADFRYRSLAQMGAELASRRGVSTKGMADIDIAEMMCSRAGYHTTSDFKHLLSNVASKMVQLAYEENATTYDQVAQFRQLANFKDDKLIVMPLIGELAETPDGKGVRYTTFSDAGLDWRGRRYTSGFLAGPEAIVNDDQNVLVSWPRDAIGAALRTRNSLFWRTVLAWQINGTALFHEDRGNLVATGGVPSAESIDALEQLAAAMTDHDGNPIDMSIKFLVGGAATRLAIAQLLGGTINTADITKNLPNAAQYQAVYERRITGKQFFGLAAQGRNGLWWGSVAGYDKPRTAVETDFDTKGVKMSVEDSFAVAVSDYRGAFKNPGE